MIVSAENQKVTRLSAAKAKVAPKQNVNTGLTVGNKFTGNIVVNDTAPLIDSQKKAEATLIDSQTQSQAAILNLGTQFANTAKTLSANNTAAVQTVTRVLSGPAQPGPVTPASHTLLYAGAGLAVLVALFAFRK